VGLFEPHHPLAAALSD